MNVYMPETRWYTQQLPQISSLKLSNVFSLTIAGIEVHYQESAIIIDISLESNQGGCLNVVESFNLPCLSPFFL